MKKILLALGATMFLGLASYAQNADLQAYVKFNDYQCLNAGDKIQDTAQNKQPWGQWGVVNRGPDEIDSGQWNWISTPINDFNVKTTEKPNGDSLLYFFRFKTRQAPVGYYVTLLSHIYTDSIKTLLDIDAYTADTTGLYSSYIVKRENFEEEKVYGFFLINRGIGDEFLKPDNIDTNKKNDIAFVPITWHCKKANIDEMIENQSFKINVFPNPAQNTLNFRYGFIQPTQNALARVVDRNGRILMTKDLGQQNFGTKEFNIDVSTLPSGNYILQITTDHINASNKFNIVK